MRPELPPEQGGCPECHHYPLYEIDGIRWCPCEDCHFGGHLIHD